MVILVITIGILIGLLINNSKQPTVIVKIENKPLLFETYNGPVPTKEQEAKGKEAIYQIFDEFPNGICFNDMPEYHDDYYKSRAPIEKDLPPGVTLSE